MEQQYNDLTMRYSVSAREYFMILRLAIYHIDGVNKETAYEITQYSKSNEVYRCACEILKALPRK